MKQIKCPHCGHWTEVKTGHCQICDNEIIDTHHQERLQRAELEKNSLPIIEIHETDSPFRKFWKKPVQVAQLIFFSIISFIAAMAAGTVH